MSPTTILDRTLGCPLVFRRAILVLIDWMLLDIALLTATVVRVGEIWPGFMGHHWWLLLLLPLISIPLFFPIGLYRTIVRYTSLDTLWTVFKSAGASALVLMALVSWTRWEGVPRSLPLLYLIFSFLFLSGYRLLFRKIFVSFKAGDPDIKKVIIYGAGSSGAQISSAFKLSDEFLPVAFVDDDTKLQGRKLNGIEIFPPDKIPELIRKHMPDFILLAMPSASRGRIREILEELEPLPVKIKRLPFLEQMVSGQIDIAQIQDIEIEDLLGRDPVPARKELLRASIQDKAVMVTGAGGSIGSELCRQISSLGPKRLVLFEHSEYALYAIESQLRQALGTDLEIVPILGSVRDYHRVKRVMSAFQVETLYHAAAYKHVPLVEYNPIEGIRNNVFGTLRTAVAAMECGVETFVLISTDKAVRPTNIMGATKRLAELILQALAARQVEGSGRRPVFTMVRFGNVLGSSGSVVPLFQKQIEQGGPVTVTHPEMTRFFMTIPEAVELVIQAGSMGKGGDLFVLDMGEPVRILDLAKKMIALSGLSVQDESNPHGDIEIKFTGLRPGEKLYEELLISDNVVGTQHPMILRANEDFMPWDQLEPLLQELEEACHCFDLHRIRKIVKKLVEDYQPQCDSVDPVWLAQIQRIDKQYNSKEGETALNIQVVQLRRKGRN